MKGIFEYSRSTAVLCALGTVFGAILMLAFPFLIMSGVSADLDTKFGFGFMCFIGLLYFAFCNLYLFMMRRGRITVDDNGVSAFCNYGFKLDCPFSQVEWAYCLGKQLTIRLKNGKRYKLTHLENASRIAEYIRHRIKSDTENDERVEELIANGRRWRKVFHGFIIAAVASVTVFFGAIVIAAVITGWRGMEEFSSGDWQKFTVMAVISFVDLALFAVFLGKAIMSSGEVDEIRLRVCRKMLLEAAPLSPFAVAAYLNDEYAPQLRAVVYRSNGEAAYFVLEGMNRNFELEVVSGPVEYASMADLLSDLSEWSKVRRTWYNEEE